MGAQAQDHTISQGDFRSPTRSPQQEAQINRLEVW